MNQVYLVTGAGHFPGIGSEVAVQLLDRGDKVAINSRQFDESWYVLSKLYIDNLLLFTADITDTSKQQEFIQQVITAWGRIDGLVNNASPTTTGTYTDNILDRLSWQDNFMLNVVAVYELSMRARPYLVDAQGSIVNISSRASTQAGIGNNFAYSSAKAAMNHLTRELALSLSPVRVNAVAPGFVPSQRLASVYKERFEDRQKQWAETSLFGEAITPQEVASSVLHLLDARQITGQLLNVCGGATIQPPVINVKP